MALVVVERQAAQMEVGQPVVLQRGDLVLAGCLPVALGQTEVVGVGLAVDSTFAIQKALLSPMAVVQREGSYKITDTVYAEVTKEISLSGVGTMNKDGNTKGVISIVGATNIYTITMNKPLLSIRCGGLYIHGGVFSTEFATSHKDYIVSVDCDFDILEKNGCKPPIHSVLLAKDGTVGRTAIVEYNDFFFNKGTCGNGSSFVCRQRNRRHIVNFSNRLVCNEPFLRVILNF